MSISQLTDDLEIISALSDEPNATDGLTATQLKAKFDEAAGIIKTYLNGTIVPAINSSLPDGQYAADAGSSDSYAITLSPAPTSYFTGMVVRFKANTANTGAATLNVNGLGAKTIKIEYNSDLVTGDIKANQIVTVMYDGTNFQMLSMSSNRVKRSGDTTGVLVAEISGGSGLVVYRNSTGNAPFESRLSTGSIYFGAYDANTFGIHSTAVLGSGKFAFDISNGTLFINGTSSIKILSGSGSPEGSVTAPIGSTYYRTDGTSGTTHYKKTSGTGNTGWTAS